MRIRYSFSSKRTRNLEKIKKQRQKYLPIAEKIIQVSDIVLEILDSRFIPETRNREIENRVINQGKRIIYVLNKSDLIERKTIKKKEIKEIYPYIFISCKTRKGIKKLRNLIKIQAKKISEPVQKTILRDQVVDSENEKIKVGIIGYPNTGKSSLINTLIGKSSAGTGSDAGFTKGFQKISFTQDIVLIDSPGVIPKELYAEQKNEKIAKQTMLGGRSYSQVREPEIVVAEIIKEYRGLLEKHYNIRAKGDSEILIEELGKQKGILKRKGEVDTDKTARLIIKDWQQGKIKIENKEH